MRRELIDNLRFLGGIFADMMQSWRNHSYRPAFVKIRDYFRLIHEEYFNRESGPEGPWTPLSHLTVKKKGFDTILIDFNNMRSSTLFTGAKDHVEDIEDAFLIWGTSDPKAIFHDQGTRRMPRRVFVGLTEDNVTPVLDIIADEAVNSLRYK